MSFLFSVFSVKWALWSRNTKQDCAELSQLFLGGYKFTHSNTCSQAMRQNTAFTVKPSECPKALQLSLIMRGDSCASNGLQIHTIERADAGSSRGFGHIRLSSPAKGLQLGCFLADSCSFEAAGRTEYFICRAPCALGALHVENINPIQTLFLFFLPPPTQRSYFGIKPSVSGLTVLSVLYYSSKVKKIMCFCPSELEKSFSFKLLILW